VFCEALCEAGRISRETTAFRPLSALLNPAAGSRYKERVLSKGGSVDPNILLENFLGREPNDQAFIKRLGL